MARYFEFLSQFYGFHLTHPRTFTFECVGMKRAQATKNQAFGKEGKTRLGLQCLRKLKNGVTLISQTAISKTDIFQFCYHGLFAFK
jgi:hypothetical protein